MLTIDELDNHTHIAHVVEALYSKMYRLLPRKDHYVYSEIFNRSSTDADVILLIKSLINAADELAG